MNPLLDRALDLGISLLALAALFIPIERAFTARTQPHLRRELSVDVAYFVAQYLVFIPLLLAFNAWLRAAVDVGVSIRDWPLVLQAVVAVVAGDVVVYWGHRLSHEIPLLWRFHRVHHSVTTLDWMAAHREHPLDGIWSQLCLMLPAFLLGVDVAALAPVFVFRGLCANFVHSNARIDDGWFRWLGLFIGDPVLHRWHHARVHQTAHNFANLAPYLDVIFGTHHRPADERYPLGLADADADCTGRNMIAHLLLPLLPVAWASSSTRSSAMARTRGTSSALFAATSCNVDLP